MAKIVMKFVYLLLILRLYENLKILILEDSRFLCAVKMQKLL